MKKEDMPIIIIPYSDGNVKFKIVGDLNITDKLDLQLADHPNIRFRYMWNATKVDQHLKKLKKRLNDFKTRVCYYWARYILQSEGFSIHKLTAAQIDSMILRAWSDDTISDEDKMMEYVDMAIYSKYDTSSKRNDKKIKSQVLNEMYPEEVDAQDNLIFFRGLETEELNISKWENIKQNLEISIECLRDKGFSLSKLVDMKLEGLVDLYTARKNLFDKSKEKFKKVNN